MKNTYTAEFWVKTIAEFKESGKTKKEFAKEHNISYPTLCYHLKSKDQSFNGFVEAGLSITQAIPQGITDKPYIEVTYNKAKIAIFGAFEEDLLLSVLRTIKQI